PLVAKTWTKKGRSLAYGSFAVNRAHCVRADASASRHRSATATRLPSRLRSSFASLTVVLIPRTPFRARRSLSFAHERVRAPPRPNRTATAAGDRSIDAPTEPRFERRHRRENPRHMVCLTSEVFAPEPPDLLAIQKWAVTRA